MANIYDMADTWNDSGTTFTAIKMNVTDTASASGSLLFDVQLDGASQASISKAGLLKLSGPSSGSAWIEGTAEFRTARCGIGFESGVGNGVVAADATGGAVYAAMGPSGIMTTESNIIGFGSTIAAAPDTAIARSSAGVMKVTDGSTGTGQLIFVVPTSDPGIAGALWNNGGTLAISA